MAESATLAARQLFGARVTVSPAVHDDKVFVIGPEFGTVWRHSSGLEVATSEGYGVYFGRSLTLCRSRMRSTLSVSIPSTLGRLSVGS